MSCGKRPLVKNWDKPRKIRVITPSRYEQNELSVKQHWKEVIRDLELSYKDEQFWETQCDTVRKLVRPEIFHRIAKIFHLPVDATKHEPHSETSIIPSEAYYNQVLSHIMLQQPSAYSVSDYELSLEDESLHAEQSESWSVSSMPSDGDLKRSSQSRAALKSKSFTLSKFTSKYSTKSLSKYALPKFKKSLASSRFQTRTEMECLSEDESTATNDDIIVHDMSRKAKRKSSKPLANPHFDMLYCNQSETDMIKWKSKYKQKSFELSASDEFSKKAEIITKQISRDFYDWWVSLGNVEFKSEIKRPEDIEDLFQVWFDEHASRGLVLNPKILPCVLRSIAQSIGVPEASCPRVLKRQIAFDIHAETSPAHTRAFNTCLPQKLKHIPPKNDTEEMWHSLKIPEDLRSMACVWEDIQHLTSTKAFQSWLQQRPHLAMPPCLRPRPDDVTGEKKQLLVLPSDYVVRDRSESESAQDLAIPISQFSLELKQVLSKLLNQ